MYIFSFYCKYLYYKNLRFQYYKCSPTLGNSSNPYPVNMPDLIRIQSWLAWKQWPEADQVHLAQTRQSARTKLDPGWFSTVWSRLSVDETKSERGKLVACHLRHARNQAQWVLHTSLLPDQMHLVKPWPGHPDQIQVSFGQYDPCPLWKNRTEVDVGSQVGLIL